MKRLALLNRLKLRGQMMLIYILCLAPILFSSIYLINGLAGIIKDNDINDTYSDSERYRERISVIAQLAEKASGQIVLNPEARAVVNGEYTELELHEANTMIYNLAENEYSISDISLYVNSDKDAYAGCTRIFPFSRLSQDIAERAGALDEKGGWFTKHSASGKNELFFIEPISEDNGDIKAVIAVTVDSRWLESVMVSEPGTISISVDGELPFFCNDENTELFDNLPPEGVKIDNDNYKYYYERKTENGNFYVVVNRFTVGDSDTRFAICIASSLDMITRSSEELYYGYIWYIALCVILSVLVIILFVSMFTRRIKVLRDQMHHAANGGFELDLPIDGKDEIAELNSDLCQMVESMQRLIDEAYSARIQSEQLKLTQVEAEFKALSSQINPHFLYNTLETIRMKAFCNNDKETAGLIKTLGKFMRRCLEVKDKFVTLESELEFTRNYLDLQAVRFGDRVSYSILNEVDGNYNILPLIIQPIVENAFVHGIEGNKSNGLITVKIFYKGEYVYIDVTDNGQGISEEKLAVLNYKLMENASSNGKSIGVTNVAKRVKLFHGDEYGLTITSTVGKGTRVRIILPRDTRKG